MRVQRLAALSVAVLVAGVLAAPAGRGEQAARFAGTYAVRGTNPGGGGGYTGTVTIRARGEVYDVTWTVGRDEFRGVGIADGDCLAVAYTDPGGSGSNVLIYHADNAGNLSGSWATGSLAKLGRETATRK